jgi:hypothetical protein
VNFAWVECRKVVLWVDISSRHPNRKFVTIGNRQSRIAGSKNMPVCVLRKHLGIKGNHLFVSLLQMRHSENVPSLQMQMCAIKKENVKENNKKQRMPENAQ